MKNEIINIDDYVDALYECNLQDETCYICKETQLESWLKEKFPNEDSSFIYRGIIFLY